ncbi:hypothetical protein V9T40_014760 [Parthenolecanium corni]|uniref:Uncharacterized protein n=1 Tax=Parthenolecanium corni TaxID=536013 RepID=A0AAN9T2R2_9HEMI
MEGLRVPGATFGDASVFLSVCLFVCLSVCLSACASIVSQIALPDPRLSPPSAQRMPQKIQKKKNISPSPDMIAKDLGCDNFADFIGNEYPKWLRWPFLDQRGMRHKWFNDVTAALKKVTKQQSNRRQSKISQVELLNLKLKSNF